MFLNAKSWFLSYTPRLFVGVVFSLIPLVGFAKKSVGIENPLDAELGTMAKKAKRILQDKSLEKIKVSVIFQRTKTGDVLFESSPDQSLHPASNTKLITTAAGLELLGPGYRWKTVLAADKFSRGHARNLYLIGKGDPRFVSESLWKLVSDAKSEHGLKRVDGNLFVDDTYFTQETMAPGFNDKNQDSAYRAASGAMSINFNSVSINIRPAKTVDSPPIVRIRPTRHHFNIKNDARTTNAGSESLSLSASAYRDKTRLHLRGRIPKSHRGLTVRRRIDNPALYAGDAAKAFLKRAGIRVKGKTKKGKAPNRVKTLSRLTSRPLSLIIQDINKLSNNFMAEQVLRTIGLVHGQAGDWKNGTKIVKNYLEKQVKIKGFNYVNGSGLFGKTSFSARQITTLLQRMAHNKSLQPEFFGSLALSRLDGTLKKRFRDMPQGTIRAKTGTLKGVICLSGYIHHKSGELITFSILMNDVPGRGWLAYKTQDRLLRVFSGYGQSNEK